MGVVVGIGAGDTGEHLLDRFARQKVTVFECGFAEVGQFGVAAGINNNPAAALYLNDVKHLRPP
jgi:hypothetical protein